MKIVLKNDEGSKVQTCSNINVYVVDTDLSWHIVSITANSSYKQLIWVVVQIVKPTKLASKYFQLSPNFKNIKKRSNDVEGMEYNHIQY